MSCVSALAAAGAWSASIVNLTSAACTASPSRGGTSPLPMSRTWLQRRSHRLLVGGAECPVVPVARSRARAGIVRRPFDWVELFEVAVDSTGSRSG